MCLLNPTSLLGKEAWLLLSFTELFLQLYLTGGKKKKNQISGDTIISNSLLWKTEGHLNCVNFWQPYKLVVP